MRILILQNDTMAPAGLVGQRLAADGADIVTVSADQGDAVPTEVGGFDGLVVLGGVQSAADFETWPYLADEAALMRRFAEADRPTLGICLGAQLLARAHGAAVRPLAEGLEIGFPPLAVTAAAATDPLFRGVDPAPQMQWHHDTFDLPDGAVLLGTSDICRNQVMRIGRCQYGVQFHFEATRAIVESWIAHFGFKLERDRPGLVALLRQELDRCAESAADYGRGLVDRWVDLIVS